MAEEGSPQETVLEELDGLEEGLEVVREEAEGVGEGDPKAPTAEDLAALQARLDASEEMTTRLTSIVSDPDVAAVVQAKDGKKALRIVVGDEAAAPEGPPALPSSVELDNMTNSQLVELMAGQVREAVTEGLSSSDLSRRLGTLETESSEGRKARLLKEAQAVQSRHPDLGEHSEAVKKLATTGVLNLEESYMIARMRSGKGLPVAPADTERPTTLTVRNAPEEKPARMGAKGFAQDLAEGMERITIPPLY